MTHPLVIIRPQPGADASAAAARHLGLEPVVMPLFAIEPIAWSLPDLRTHDALVIGSANALRHIGPALDSLNHLPVYAVGASTAALAREMGFAKVVAGTGGLQALVPRIVVDNRRHVLRLVGDDHLPLALPATVAADLCVVYRSQSLPMTDELARVLSTPAVVLLHSANAAQHFAFQCTANDIDRGLMHLATLGPRIAQAAGQGWAAIKSADNPDEKALLALAAQMCKTAVPCEGITTLSR